MLAEGLVAYANSEDDASKTGEGQCIDGCAGTFLFL